MRIFLFSLLLLSLLGSCGPERDAREVCECYDEVYHLKGEAATTKMNECMNLLNKYTKKYKGTDEEKEFDAAFLNCR
ncbi:MAG: hypothetical protein K1X56_08470 [Flavobacteriales bacterium]|nr:hypothetical protein [Flavobacteriales bacterium]